MKNNLDDAFNITPTEVEVDHTEVKEPVGIQKPDRLTKDDIEKDYEYTRGNLYSIIEKGQEAINGILELAQDSDCLLYTSPSPRDLSTSRMPSSA